MIVAINLGNYMILYDVQMKWLNKSKRSYKFFNNEQSLLGDVAKFTLYFIKI